MKSIYLGSNHDNSGDIYISDTPLNTSHDNTATINTDSKYVLVCFSDESIWSDYSGDSVDEIYESYKSEHEEDEELTKESFIRMIEDSYVDNDSGWAMFIFDTNMFQPEYSGECMFHEEYIEEEYSEDREEDYFEAD